MVLGLPEEVRVVRWMFRQSAAGVECNTIMRKLNARGVINARGGRWSFNGVRQMLDDERYIGTSIFARTTQAIGRVRGALTPEREVRLEQAFPALVSPELFKRARAVREERNRKETDEQMLDAMRALWKHDGKITSRRLNTFSETPTVQAYLRRFGSLRAAYRQIVYAQGRDLTYGDLRERSRPWRTSILRFLSDRLEEDGSLVERDGWVLRVDGAWTVGIRLLQAGRFHGTVRWEVRPWQRSVDLIVAARMETDGSTPEIFGDIVSASADIQRKLGNDCAAVGLDALGDLADSLGKMAAVMPSIGNLEKGIAKREANAAGRAVRQKRLRELMNDDKLGSADRGWLRQDANDMARNPAERPGLRNPPGKQLAHERGREAAKGYGYEHSHLQDADTHRGQHKLDNNGRANIPRPAE